MFGKILYIISSATIQGLNKIVHVFIAIDRGKSKRFIYINVIGWSIFFRNTETFYKFKSLG